SRAAVRPRAGARSTILPRRLLRLGRAASAQRPRSGSDRGAKAETFRERGLPLAAYQLTYLAFPASGKKAFRRPVLDKPDWGSEDPRAPTYPRPALSLRETS